jgi:hypothetical protein
MTQVLNPQVAIFWMIELNSILRAFSGNTEEGWSILDNSALFNRSLYRAFCVPVPQRVMDALAPAGAHPYPKT